MFFIRELPLKMIKKLLLLIAGFAFTLVVNANHHTLTLHMNDNMGSSGTFNCNDYLHCKVLIKEFEYHRSPGDCNFVEIKADNRTTYRKFYRD